MTFQLTEGQGEKLRAWCREEDEKVAARQRGNPNFAHYEAIGLLPYYGCVGGVLTYHFTPCSIGITVRVTHGGTKAELDLTESDDW